MAQSPPRPTNRTPSIASRTSETSPIRFASDVRPPNPVPREVIAAIKERGFEVDNEGVVRWAPDSVAHPRRWPLDRKLYDTTIICLLEFVMTAISNAGSSVSPLAAEDLAASQEMSLFCFTTVYLLGQGFAGLVLPPITENFGGKTIYVTSTFAYAMLCFMLALWPTLPAVLICRFGTGLISAMPAVVAAGSIENMWDMISRTFVVHIWISGAVFGLVVGPAIATYIAISDLGWRADFLLAGTTIGGLALLCFWMEESRPSKVLTAHVRAVSKLTAFQGLSVEDCSSIPTFRTFVRTSLLLPVKLFFTESIVALTSVMAATVYGVVYLFSECLTVVYVEQFGFGIGEASLIILAIGAGIPFTFLPRLYDLRMMRACHQSGKTLQPEDKLFGFYVAAPVLAVGLWWFACSVPPLVNTFPWVSMVALAFIGFSVVEFDSLLAGYLCDTYASYAASANAPMAFLRCMMSGGFPLFGQQMFRRLGPNIALFLLASIATLYCGVAVFFHLYGKRIRARSPFAEATRATTEASVKAKAERG